jgi:hypothetical protein
MKSLLRLLHSATLVCAASTYLRAEPFTADGGRVAGTVYDSAQRRPLIGAVVRLSPGSLVAKTDSTGAFQFDDVPAGKYELSVTHRTLVALGETITRAVAVTDKSLTTADLFTSNAETVRSRFCAGDTATGRAAFVGMVSVVETRGPAAGATVTLLHDIAGATPDSDRVETLTATTGSDGRFAFCNLPIAFYGRAQAQLKGPKTAELVAEDIGSGIGALAFTVGSTIGQIRGIVRDERSNPVAKATIILQGMTAESSSADDGTFSVDSVAAGTQRLVVRKIGFIANEVLVDVGAGSAPSEVQLSRVPAALPSVTVSAPPLPAALTELGFEKRRSAGKGFFMTRSQFPSTRSLEVSELFRRVPHIHVEGTAIMWGTRRPCFWVDGVYWTMGISQFLDRRQLSAFEVYEPTMAPPRFQMNGVPPACDWKLRPTIVFWSRWRIDDWQSP